MYIKAATDFISNNKRFPKELHIIDVDTSILKCVQHSVENWQRDASSIDQKVTVPKFLARHPAFNVGSSLVALDQLSPYHIDFININ